VTTAVTERAELYLLPGIEPRNSMLQIMDPPARWYAIHTRSRFEKSVRTELTSRGIDNYLAEFTEVHHWKDRKKEVAMPLFPGYIFAHFRETEKARLEVLRTNGVVRILGVNSAIESIPDEEIESIRQLLVSGKQCYPYPFAQEGSWIRVRRGPLTGVEGRLVQIKSETRLVLSINLLSRSVATEVDARDVEPAREPRAIQ
jgi:transcription termination/antitermination protein NusG